MRKSSTNNGNNPQISEKLSRLEEKVKWQMSMIIMVSIILKALITVFPLRSHWCL